LSTTKISKLERCRQNSLCPLSVVPFLLMDFFFGQKASEQRNVGKKYGVTSVNFD